MMFYLCCSFLLTLFPCCSVGSLPRDTVLHELLQCESFPWAAVLHKLLQYQYFSWGAVLQEQSTPAWALDDAAGPSRSLLHCGLSMGYSFLQVTYVCSSMASSMCCSVDMRSTMNVHGLQGDNLLCCGLHHRLQGNLF